MYLKYGRNGNTTKDTGKNTAKMVATAITVKKRVFFYIFIFFEIFIFNFFFQNEFARTLPVFCRYCRYDHVLRCFYRCLWGIAVTHHICSLMLFLLIFLSFFKE